MSQSHQDPRTAGARPIIEAFPKPGPRIERAYHELATILHGTEEEKRALGPPHLLARPWDPPSCADPELRAEVWDWLERFVAWLNHEYTWDPAGLIPACWPRHPHLVHEIAALADLRRTAGRALTGEDLESWHRYALPAFTERTRQRMSGHCEDRDHQPWPGHSRHTRHQSEPAVQARWQHYDADITAAENARADRRTVQPVLHAIDGLKVDPDTGEISDH